MHIGYPKCFSTTLQRNFFSQHPQIHYGGIGINSNIDYANSDLNLLFESGIIYFRDAVYNKHKAKFHDILDKFYKTASINKKIFGFSSEHLLFNITPQGIDYQNKLRRIKELFGSNIIIILIFRDQIDFIKSLYKEYVRLGYTHSYEDFNYWIYKYQDRNFFCELLYGDVVEYIYTLFKKDNVLVLNFKKYKPRDIPINNDLFIDISRFLRISQIDIDYNNYNPSLKDNYIPSIIEKNKRNRHDLGLEMLEGFENFRRRVFYNDFFKLNISEEEMFIDVIRKRENVQVFTNKTDKVDIFHLNNVKYFKSLEEVFQESNEKLLKLIKA